jgi:hypothetical protein
MRGRRQNEQTHSLWKGGNGRVGRKYFLLYNVSKRERGNVGEDGDLGEAKQRQTLTFFKRGNTKRALVEVDVEEASTIFEFLRGETGTR